MGEDEKEKGGQQHEGHESRREATWGKEEANGVAEEVSEGRRPTKKKMYQSVIWKSLPSELRDPCGRGDGKGSM